MKHLSRSIPRSHACLSEFHRFEAFDGTGQREDLESTENGRSGGSCRTVKTRATEENDPGLQACTRQADLRTYYSTDEKQSDLPFSNHARCLGPRHRQPAG
ncbi:hypothetical protein K0M31_005425 [Melipona bicolor]|uniref:Uncharacterized protein n=1 Tax=Melipona bicolor TaxID=60889 RepID=A0AA40FV89_9HYME|nr:hypothetical protein K0M31_005425 [Melipona bicolor]